MLVKQEPIIHLYIIKLITIIYINIRLKGNGDFMFFMAGVFPQKKELKYYKTILCSCCSKYGRYEAFMECSVLSLFLIPVFKFNKKIYIRTTCCNSIYLITNKEKASMIEKGQGEDLFLKDEDMQLIQKGYGCNAVKCQKCGFEIDDDYKYCPNCGNPLK